MATDASRSAAHPCNTWTMIESCQRHWWQQIRPHLKLTEQRQQGGDRGLDCVKLLRVHRSNGLRGSQRLDHNKMVSPMPTLNNKRKTYVLCRQAPPWDALLARLQQSLQCL